jgi:hypothetical protein
MVSTPEIVLVDWADAHTSEGGWITLDDYTDDGEAIVRSVGFLIKEGEKGAKRGHVTLWQTFSDGDVIHAMHIPLAMVRKITVMSKKDKKS